MRYACESDAGKKMSLEIATLAPCIKEGFDSPEKLAIRYISGEKHSRVFIHELHSALSSIIPPGDEFEGFASTMRRVRQTMTVLGVG
jgi:hypothetical protein